MTKSKINLIKGGQKGGKSKSLVKRQAAKRNLRLANEGRKIAMKIRLIDWKIANNGTLRRGTDCPKVIKALEKEFSDLLSEREKLMKGRMDFVDTIKDTISKK